MLKDVLWALSNITAGTENQIREFASDQSRFKVIFELMEDINPEVVREATYIITNLLTTVQECHQLIYNVATCNEGCLIKAIVNGLKIDQTNEAYLTEIL